MLWLPACLEPALHREQSRVLVSLACFAMCIPGFFLRGQLQLQFAHPRSRLVPGFAGPHLALAGLLIALVGVAPAAVVAHLSASSPSALVAIALILGAGIAGLRSLFFWFLIPIQLAVTSTDIGRQAAESYVNGDFPLVTAGCLALAVAITVGSARRLMQMHEEMPEYNAEFINEDEPINSIFAGVSPSILRQRRENVTRQISRSKIQSRRIDRRYDSAVRLAAREGYFARARVFRSIRQRNCFFGVMFLVFFLFFIEFILLTVFKAEIGVICFAPYFITFMVAGNSTSPIGENLSWEFVRPVERRRFVRELFINAAVDLFILDAASIAVILFSFVTFQPQLRAPFPVDIFLLLHALLFPISLGLIMWLHTFRHELIPLLVMLTSFGGFLIYVGSILTGWQHDVNPTSMVTTILVLALLGVGAMRLAYHSWYNYELT
jgi:hypothetical protein